MGISVTPPSTLGFNTSIVKDVKKLNNSRPEIKSESTPPTLTDSNFAVTRSESNMPANSVELPTPGGLGVAVAVKSRGNETSVTGAVSYSSGQLKTSVTVNNKGVGALNVGVGDVNARINTNGQASLTVKNGDVKINASTGSQGTSLEAKVNVVGDKPIEPFNQEKSDSNLNSSSEEYRQSRPHI